MFVVRSITRPLVRAVEFAGAIADGDLTGSITVTHKDETGELLQALMSMKVRLQEIVHQVQQGGQRCFSP